MSFFDVATQPLVYILVALGLVIVAVAAIISARKAYQRCLDAGMSKSQVQGIIRASSLFSLVPSFSIVVGLISLSALIGLPWAWWRLSVVGAVSYETMTAQMAAEAMGYTAFAEAPASVFGSVMLVMSSGIIFGDIVLIFVGKPLMTGYAKQRSRGSWGIVFNSCFMLAMFATLIPGYLTKGAVYFMTFLSSMALSICISKTAEKLQAKWLEQFNLAICLIVGMALSVLWTAILV